MNRRPAPRRPSARCSGRWSAHAPTAAAPTKAAATNWRRSAASARRSGRARPSACTSTRPPRNAPTSTCQPSSDIPANPPSRPLDHAPPLPSTATTRPSAARPKPVRPSHRERAAMRGHTRRSFQTSTSASAAPPAACAANTQALCGEPANHVASPVPRPSATSSARLQSVPRGVTVRAILRTHLVHPRRRKSVENRPSRRPRGALWFPARTPVRISFFTHPPASGC